MIGDTMEPYIALGGLGLVWIAAVLSLILPVMRTGRALTDAGERVSGILSEDASDPVSALAHHAVFPKDVKLNALWLEYLLAARKAGDPAFVPLSDYMDFDRILAVRSRLSLASVLPSLLTVTGVLASALLLLFPAAGKDIRPECLYPAAAGMALGLVFQFIYRPACAFAKKSAENFSAVLRRFVGSGAEKESLLLSEIARALREQNTLQTGFYESLARRTPEGLAAGLLPSLKDIEKKVDGFLAAVTVRQEESMARLADEFVSALGVSFASQFSELSKTVAQMTELQERTAASLENMRDIASSSADALARVQEASGRMFAQFGGTIEKFEAVGGALTENLSALTGLTEYMREGAALHSDVVRAVSDYRQEFAKISGLYTSTMEGVVADIRDQFSSAMISLRAVSADMLKSGEHLRGAYADFSASTVSAVENTFRQFDENLTSISSHLAGSIGDLQDAVDELPAILKAVHFAGGRGDEG